MSPSELAYLDGRDPVVNIIRETLEQVEWVKNRTDTARANPDPAGEDVWTVSSLKTVVKALEVGVTAPLPKARRTYLSTDDGKQESVENLSAFLNWATNRTSGVQEPPRERTRRSGRADTALRLRPAVHDTDGRDVGKQQPDRTTTRTAGARRRNAEHHATRRCKRPGERPKPAGR